MSDVDQLKKRIDDFNQQIIDEFRANEGKVGGPFAGAPMLLLHTSGAKTRQPRLSPLVYAPDGDRIVIFGSNGGAPAHPAWYHNLVANPGARVEVGRDTFDVTARVAAGAERERLWTLVTKDFPGFVDYEQKTDREIPVVILEPAA